ncbi:MAG: transcriptional regulator [Nonomuraea sp.]|nr:transcriptional regulator [Nonomuraea sp.]
MARLDTLLAGFARERSTGALRVGRAGTIYLDEGRVTFMECAQTPSAERLMILRGRISESALRRFQADGGCDRLLVESRITLGELQYLVLGAVLDAAFFLLPATGTRPKFQPGQRHWLGGRWFFEVAGLVRETARRRARLAHVWPCADADAAPVRPAARLSGTRVTLSDTQWEVLVGADRESTPLELARQLGRSGYSVLLAVRELACAGLIEAAAPLPRRGERPALERPPHDAQAPRMALGPAVTADPTDLTLLMRLKKALEEMS